MIPTHSRPIKIASNQFLKLLFSFTILLLICHHISLSFLHRNCSGADSPPQNPHQFNISNVRRHLKKITNFGVKNTGSFANENLTANYILKTIQEISSSPHNNKNIIYDVQKVSGTFTLKFVENFISIYENIQNIIVRLKPSSQSSSPCLLLNCHFDSAIGSPGASDDIISCANLLEILRIASIDKSKAQNCLIFLFNGGEENILQASHGFTTQHSWLNDIYGFVNLEACGSGGSQMLFQSGPGSDWLLRLYGKKAPSPFGSVVAQDIFGTGMIPSDTDFRIFERFGNISGIDFAFFVNGYVYHTPDDVEEVIDDCTIFKSGRNILGLALGFLETDDLSTSPGRMGYFDLFSTFFFTFPLSWTPVMCYSVLLLSLLSIYQRISGAHYILRYKLVFLYVSASLFLITTVLSSLVVNLLLSLSFYLIRLRMVWFSNYLNLFLYFVPSFLVVMASHHYFALTWRYENKNVFTLILLESFALLNVIASFILSSYGKGSLIYLLINSVSINIYSRFCRRFGPNLPVCLCVLFLPIYLSLSAMQFMLSGIIPIMGRSGSFIPSDILISLLMAFFTSYLLTFMVEVFHADFDCKKLVRWILVIYFIFVVFLYFTPLGFPFSNSPGQPRKRRILIINACRSFAAKDKSIYQDDCGIYLVPLDSYDSNKINLGPQTPLNHRIELNKSEPYHGFPFFLPLRSLYGNVYKVDGWNDQSVLKLNRTFRVLSKTLLSRNSTRVSIEVDVVNNCNFAVLPVRGRIMRLELMNEIYKLNSSSNIFVFYVNGLVRKPFQLNFDVESFDDVDESSIVAKFSVSWTLFSHNMNLAGLEEKETDRFVRILPDWITPTVIRSKYSSIDL